MQKSKEKKKKCLNNASALDKEKKNPIPES